MLQAGIVILKQYVPDGLFRRVKSDPSIIISAHLVLSRDLIRIPSMSARNMKGRPAGSKLEQAMSKIPNIKEASYEQC